MREIKLNQVIEEIETNLTTITWYGRTQDQQPEIMLEKKTLEQVWETIRNNKSLTETSMHTNKISRLLNKRTITSIINATPKRIAPRKEKKYIELYGTINEAVCRICKRVFETKSLLKEKTDKTIPECHECGAPLIPNIEPYVNHLSKTLYKAIRSIMTSELLIVIGKSDLIEPGSHLPWLARKIAGIKLIEINNEKTTLTPETDFFLKEDPDKTLKLLSETI